ncbi:hypothetical protein ACFFS2_16060 [Streptomyces aurantiacus]|uniref:Uncharacterized protein n=1 Tax=Streptomyces aurantiacus TaxID=47760 RepID=A0A7G1NT63_9ACTN|nr:hypothetical protein [Streptomyces aurantiacus]BCL26069.1 hypothetical protein GCM10017557_09280 [Streptomyces aurantiacus]
MNSHNTPSRPAGSRPLRKRGRAWAVGTALLALGLVGCQDSGKDDADTARTVASRPTPTVTVTATVTNTAEPEPAPTVTKTKKVTRPGPTVTVTKAAQAAGSGSGSSSGGGSSTCSIVSNSGNCYQAGQFCRNSDHGASTTTAGGARITCTYSANAWRWASS